MAKTKNKQKKDFPIFTVFCIVIGLLLAVGITLTVLDNTGFGMKRKTVLTVGDESINALEFNYAYSTVYNSYSTYLSYFGVDTSASGWVDGANTLDSSKGETWKEYFVNSAAETLKQELALYQLAVNDADFTIDKDAIDEQINASIESDKTSAEAYGVDIDTLYSAQFGKGFKESTMRKMLEYSLVADAYRTHYSEGLSYDDAALEKYYGEHKTDFDVYSFISLDFAYEEPKNEDKDEDTEKKEASDAEKAAKADAEAYVEANKASEEDFAAGNKDTVKSEKKTYSEVSTSVGSEGQKWISDSERKAGDTTVVKGSGDKYVALYFLGSERDEYKLANVRIIRLDPTVADSDKGATDEELKALKEKAASVFETLKKDPTEDKFKELASKNSADKSTASDGGLTEGMTKTTAKVYSADLAAWVFDSSRKQGDFEMFEGSKTYYIVYYLSEGEVYWKNTSESRLRSSDTSDWIEKCIESLKDRTEFDSAAAIENIG